MKGGKRLKGQKSEGKGMKVKQFTSERPKPQGFNSMFCWLVVEGAQSCILWGRWG